MSEPARGYNQRTSPPVPPRPRSAQLPELHPNQEVLLDDMGEGEMVENKLVIPDEMMQYLNQVRFYVIIILSFWMGVKISNSKVLGPNIPFEFEN